MKMRFVFFLFLLGSIPTGCVPIAMPTAASGHKSKNLQRESGAAQEVVIKANAAASGYKMKTGEMEAFVMVAFEALEIQPIVCLERFDGIAYCGTFQPSYDDHWDPKPPAFADTFKRRFPDDLNGALPLTPWTKGEGYHWRSYVIDGIHVVKLYRIRKRGDTQLAIAFEGP